METALDLTHEEKIAWMAVWAAKNDLQLMLHGEIGFGRECVGVICNGSYPEYEWSDEERWDRLDKNGEVWVPVNAYHKGPYVAVLGRGEDAEAQLYDWLKWFDDNGFHLETGEKELDPKLPPALTIALGKHRYARMVRGEASA